MFTVYSSCAEATANAGRIFSAYLMPGDTVALFGGMGMGKTVFTGGLAAGLHSRDDVSSPTFAIVNEYRADMPVRHFDMYRITSWEDLQSTGYFDYFDGRSIAVIEWSENIENALPEDCWRLYFEADGNRRVIRIIKGSEAAAPQPSDIEKKTQYFLHIGE